MTGDITFRLDAEPDDRALAALFAAAWGSGPHGSFAPVLARSLVHVTAHDGDRLIGFVNVATDGGIHAFLLDTTVDPDFQRRGIATELVRRATQAARERGAEWLHVDYETRLAGFYRGCGFRDTAAGLIRLQVSDS